jgi:ribosomal protein L12E/L44/L45/RPP1/RPP2
MAGLNHQPPGVAQKQKVVIMVDWSDERIAALSDQDLKNLLVNAERKSAASVVAQCQAEIDKRDAAKPRKAPKARTEVKEFEHEMSGQLAVVGKQMAEKYDLSEETAKARSEGVKGFRSHKLLDAKGYAKLGGSQRDGTVAVDRYISYRRGNDVVSLGVWLPKDAPIEDHEFHVSAPAGMIEGGKSSAEVRPGISEKEAQETRRTRAFKDLPSAAAAFDAALAKITA